MAGIFLSLSILCRKLGFIENQQECEDNQVHQDE